MCRVVCRLLTVVVVVLDSTLEALGEDRAHLGHFGEVASVALPAPGPFLGNHILILLETVPPPIPPSPLIKMIHRLLYPIPPSADPRQASGLFPSPGIFRTVSEKEN